ncbi:MAG: YkvA family protein [Myxococcota bacterium]
MSDSDVAKYLDTFPTWLRNLGHDAEELAELLPETTMADDAREAIAGGLNYLFKSLDLIPDGIDDIGYLDDAFVLRVAADLASREDTGKADADKLQTLSKLTNECDVIREFLGDDFGRLESYVMSLRTGAARGRSVDDILGNEEVQREFLSDVRGFAKTYESPSFAREEKNLIKLKAFFEAKLPH